MPHRGRPPVSIESASCLAAHVLAWAVLALVLLGMGEAAIPALGPISAFRLHLGLAAGAFLALALPIRAWSVAVPVGAALLAAAVTLGPVWNSPERPAAGPGKTVRLLFANVRVDNDVPHAMQEAILAHDPDIVVTAEAPWLLAYGPLDRHYPHRVLRRMRAHHAVHRAIWSRYPVDHGAVNLDPNAPPRSVSAVIHIDEATRLGLIGVHFHGIKNRLDQRRIDGLTRLAADVGPPLAIVGDFNAVPWSRVVSEAAAATGTVPAGGYRATWHGKYPLGIPAVLGHAIDHLLTSPGIGIASLKTVPIPGSDHLGLVAELVVPPTDWSRPVPDAIGSNSLRAASNAAPCEPAAVSGPSSCGRSEHRVWGSTE